MDQQQLEVLDYLVEYSDLLDDTAREIAEKILFDGSLDDLDAAEQAVYEIGILPKLNPDCEGSDPKGCPDQAQIDSESVLECYQNVQFLCSQCSSMAGLRQVS